MFKSKLEAEEAGKVMEEFRKLTTQEKALRINLSKAIYGSFAEIGAGQEVAANFFKVGGE